MPTWIFSNRIPALPPEACGIRTNQAAEQLPYDRPPSIAAGFARIDNSAISPGCVISGRVEHSILSPGVTIEEGAFVKDSIVMHDSVIKRGARVERSIIDKEAIVGEESAVGMGDPGVANGPVPGSYILRPHPRRGKRRPYRPAPA